MNSSSKLSRSRLAVLALLLCAASGCYVLQSVQGQLALMSKRQPISRVIAFPGTSPALRAQLEEVASLRDFASRQLGLPDNGSYRSYADVGRPYVVWTVVAAPEFSVQPKEWCFPVVGCVTYRGYFLERRAHSYAAHLMARGFDVSIAGVAAYSTLGHFDDPIINTMMGWDDADLAAIVFHELTHQLLYVPGDASFNEALATTVEEEGVRRWLTAKGRDGALAEHREFTARYLAVIDLLRHARSDLKVIYASGIDADQMRKRKHQTFGALRDAYQRLRSPWHDHAPFESWFKGTINNAQLASVATYYDCVPGFERELKAAHYELPAFFRRVVELGKLERTARDAAVCGADEKSWQGELR